MKYRALILAAGLLLSGCELIVLDELLSEDDSESVVVLDEVIDYGELIVECIQPNDVFNPGCTKECVFNYVPEYWFKSLFFNFDPTTDDFNDFAQRLANYPEPLHIMLQAGTYSVTTQVTWSPHCDWQNFEEAVDWHFDEIIIEGGTTTVKKY